MHTSIHDYYGINQQQELIGCNMSSNNSNSCVETPAAPDWLSKLEDRREKLKKTKLGHETGAGAPCNQCGNKCPGLDLHFWRKVCRNCKCRKDQHMCKDDEISGWAQFEILGQIRSKPAFIKIKTLANQPLKLDWIPPNVAPDLAADYMEKLGTANVPVAGSVAAAKRKQQLEFQVPPHDLDAYFCDNLTESETDQLQQYVQKIRDNCVGQGNVVRVGSFGNAILGTLNALQKEEIKYDVTKSLDEAAMSDHILSLILSNEKIVKALTEDNACEYPKIFVAFPDAISDVPLSAIVASKLRPATKQILRGLDEEAVQSLILNGPVYDRIFGILKRKNFDISRDPRLGPLHDFRQEYLTNSLAKKELDEVFGKQNNEKTYFNSPLKTPSKLFNDLTFHSPLATKATAQLKSGSQRLQETPIRKVNFDHLSSIIDDCNFPSNVDYERDPIFANIIRSEILKRAIQKAKSTHSRQSISLPNFMPGTCRNSLAETDLSDQVKEQLKGLGIESKDILQSAVLNNVFYERLLKNLWEKNIDYSQCKFLKPFELLSKMLRTNRPFYEVVREYVTSLPNSLDVAYTPISMSLQQSLSASKSTDSGFESKPSTPTRATTTQECHEEINAVSGKILSIPGIEDMNMYPTIQLATGIQNLSLADEDNCGAKLLDDEPKITLKCRDCSKNIDLGEVAVKAERAGKEIAWHPECFKCYTCRELLADLVYFFHGGQVFCGRDLALKFKIPRCKACDELIFTKSYTAAENATFHIKHFCCYHCDLPLAGKQYIPDEKSNMPLCLKCYNEYFAVACQRCSQTIEPLHKGVAWADIHWHDYCFVCSGNGCGKSLIGGRFCVKQNMPFCSPACVRSINQQSNQ